MRGGTTQLEPERAAYLCDEFVNRDTSFSVAGAVEGVGAGVPQGRAAGTGDGEVLRPREPVGIEAHGVGGAVGVHHLGKGAVGVVGDLGGKGGDSGKKAIVVAIAYLTGRIRSQTVSVGAGRVGLGGEVAQDVVGEALLEGEGAAAVQTLIADGGAAA